MERDEGKRNIGADLGAGGELHARLGIGELDHEAAVAQFGLDRAVDRFTQQWRDFARKCLLARIGGLLGGPGRGDGGNVRDQLARQHGSGRGRIQTP